MSPIVSRVWRRRRLHSLLAWFSVGWSLSACEERSRQRDGTPHVAPAMQRQPGVVFAQRDHPIADRARLTFT